MDADRNTARYLRSSKEVPSRLIAATALLIGQDVAVARRHRFVPLDERIRWALEKADHVNALWRVTYALTDLADIAPDSIAEYGKAMHSVTYDRRRPLPDLTQGGDRKAPPLF